MVSKNKTNIRHLSVKFKKHRFKVILSDVLIFNFFRRLHGRFWGLVGIAGMVFGVFMCFVIRPDLFTPSTALSDFGTDVRTAPYFAGSVFFGSYGLFRWRIYLKRTLKRTRPVISLLALTIIGLLIIAFMPASWGQTTYKFHLVGVGLTGISIALTVILDIMLSKTRKNQNTIITKFVKTVSFLLIISGGWITLWSSQWLGLYNISLIGEGMMIGGFSIWITIKTYQGEDPRSRLSKLMSKIVLVD